VDREKIKAWIQASRPPFFIATLIPIVIGWLMAKAYGCNGGRFVLVLIACFVVHFVTNIANDYFDYIQGTDSGSAIGGSRVIQQDKITLTQLGWAIILLYFIGFIISLYIVFGLKLYGLAPLILFAFFSSLFYVAPPIRYGYHGLGELFVAINMGPIMVVGTYWVIAGHPSWNAFFVSIPIGLMVASILYYQSIPDMKTDEAVGKRTLAVRLGKPGAFFVLVLWLSIIYCAILALVAGGLLTWFSLLSLLTVPIFLKLIRIVRSIEDWVLLDQYGKYVRMLYFFNGIAIILGIM
jgi:1,4-dihydroxy-2-naphthoate octaprenyltransferase